MSAEHVHVLRQTPDEVHVFDHVSGVAFEELSAAANEKGVASEDSLFDRPLVFLLLLRPLGCLLDLTGVEEVDDVALGVAGDLLGRDLAVVDLQGLLGAGNQSGRARDVVFLARDDLDFVRLLLLELSNQLQRAVGVVPVLVGVEDVRDFEVRERF